MSDLLEKYADQYSRGDVVAENYTHCAAFLRGFREGIMGQLSQDGMDELQRCITLLSGAGNLVAWIERQPVGKK